MSSVHSSAVGIALPGTPSDAAVPAAIAKDDPTERSQVIQQGLVIRIDAHQLDVAGQPEEQHDIGVAVAKYLVCDIGVTDGDVPSSSGHACLVARHAHRLHGPRSLCHYVRAYRTTADSRLLTPDRRHAEVPSGAGNSVSSRGGGA
jgi:hypothetical protein